MNITLKFFVDLSPIWRPVFILEPMAIKIYIFAGGARLLLDTVVKNSWNLPKINSLAVTSGFKMKVSADSHEFCFRLCWEALDIKWNLYKDLPEQSGGSILVCNKWRVTENYFWKKGCLINRFFSIWDLKPFHKLVHVPFVQYFHTLTWDDGNN